MASRHAQGAEKLSRSVEVAELLMQLGFPEPTEVGGLRTLVHMFGARKPRTGVYALVLPQDRVYVGQATDVVRRFAQHRLAHEAIEAFAFVPVRRAQLDDRERELIYAAERLGLRLTNIVHVSDVDGESDLDLVVPPVLQERWLRDPGQVNAQERGDVAMLELPPAQRDRYADRFARLRASPMGPAAINLLAAYLEGCVPLPRTTEYSFWSVSCLPAPRTAAGGRLLCVSAGVIELLTVFDTFDEVGRATVSGFVNVAGDVLEAEQSRRHELAGQVVEIDFRPAPYRFAGQDVVGIDFEGECMGAEALADPVIQRAAGALMMRVMRKRGTIYTKFHCRQLAEAALLRTTQTETSVGGGAPFVGGSEEVDPIVGQLLGIVPQWHLDQVFEILAAAIEFAHRARPDRWGIRVRDDGLMLSVGPHPVLQLSPLWDSLHLVVERAAVTEALRKDPALWFSEDLAHDGLLGAVGFYPSHPGSEACEVPFGHVSRVFPVIRAAFEACVEHAAAMRRSPQTRRTHMPNLVREISHQVGRLLPQPSYVDG